MEVATKTSLFFFLTISLHCNATFAGRGFEEHSLRNFNHIYEEIVYIDSSRENHG